jgi:hypothetical protein
MAASPQEEIDRQHQEANQLIENGIVYAEPTYHQEIPLHHKERPTCEIFPNRLVLVEATEHGTLENSKDVDAKSADNPQGDSDDGAAEAEAEALFAYADRSSFPCWSSRGNIDITDLQNLMREGFNLKNDTAAPVSQEEHNTRQRRVFQSSDVESPTNLWDMANAAVNNVAIVRPSHDAWGIKKVVLIFCDDFLRDIYELPWWHGRSDIRDAIQPILDQLQISPDRIARLLLASLPPGVTIPVHHDTGEWVKHTHRVHVPVLVKNPSKILFRCGLLPNTIQPIECTPGHVFEINNQAKHAVSNCDDDYRVHLILDYVDADFSMRPRIPLQPGERILQTRRSIDRLTDRGQRPTPSFMILGAQKAGTTSLYEYMVQHPLIVRARRRETHCLDWRWNDKCTTTESRREHCHKFYYADDLQLHPSLLTGDSTPSYLLDSRRVIPRLQEVFNWKMKFIVMLRNPVKRAESHYAMVTSSEGTEAQLRTRGAEWRDKSFWQVIMEDLDKMQECGLIPYWNITEGTLDEEIFASFSGSEEEDLAWDRYMQGIPLNTGSYCLLGRGLYELNVRPWFRAFGRADFLIVQLEKMKDRGVNAIMQEVWQHLDVPSVEVEDETPKNTRDYGPISDTGIADYLGRFFQPHNQRLASTLGAEWQDVWGCNL